MIQLILRGMFIVMTAAVAGLYAIRTFTESANAILLSVIIALLLSSLIVVADIFTPRKRLSSISGVFLGLIVGMLAAYALSFLIEYTSTLFPNIKSELIEGAKVFVGVICIFVAISLILQTKDDFRFVIPYVEFAKQIRGNRPMLLDTSAIIDGRILDIVQTQILQGMLVVPRFVLNELQAIADSADRLKRARGRRGLEIVGKLQHNPHIDVSIEDADSEGATVDHKLVSMAQDLHARLLTTDFNLTKVAQLRGVDVVNINSLAEALRPVVLPGELMSTRIVKPGESPGQGIGYLEDGTMVVVENARDRMGQDVALTVTNVLQSPQGRMIFGRFAHAEDGGQQPSQAPDPADSAPMPSAPPGAQTAQRDSGPRRERATPRSRR